MWNSCKQQYIMKCQFTYAIGQNWSGKQLWTHTGTFDKIPFIPLIIHSDAEMAGIQWYSTKFEQTWNNSRFFADVCSIFNFFSNQVEYQIIQIQISYAILLLLRPKPLCSGSGWIVESNFSIKFGNLKGIGFKNPSVEHMQHFGKVLAMWFQTFEVQAECSICKTLVVMLLGTATF